MGEKVYSDKLLVDFLSFLAEYVPTFPDELVDYYAASSGFQSSDVGTRRLLSVAVQKFVADVASDAMHFQRMRQGAAAKRKPTLTHDDLVSALKEYGVQVKKPEYYADSRNDASTSNSAAAAPAPPTGND